MKRRTFLHQTTVAAGALFIQPAWKMMEGKAKHFKKLTILHTNDTHSNIDPFPANHAKYPNQGGVARRFDLIQRIKSEEEHVLVLDSGDIFQGTPYFNKYHGVLEMKLMSELGYDASTMGNHDFDIGLEGFLNAKQHARFPFLCANYDFSETLLKEHTQKHLVLERGGLKIGIFGLGVELKGLVPESNYGNTRYLDPIETANQQAKELRLKGCDLVICLSHLGFEHKDDKVSDKVLASKTSGIHLILGGHTHTFLDKPFEAKNSEGELVLINQAGYAGVQMGRLEYCLMNRKFVKHQVLEVKN
jgi:5'-nucleotidase